jgi:glucose/arabinose dehydrogenase
MKCIFRGIMIAILACTTGFAQQATTSPSNGAATQNSQTPAPTSQPAAQNPQGSATRSAAGQPMPSQEQGGKKIAPGSVIPVELTKTVDAKKAKVGDKVEAKVTQDMKAQNGEIVVAKDTKVVGKVTEAQPRDKQQKESQLAIAFDQMVTKSSGDISVPMSIQAIIAPSTNQSNNSNAAAQGTPESMPSAPGASGNTGARPGMGGGAA